MKLLDAYIWQIPINKFEDDYYNILEGQILDSIVMNIVRFHWTVTDELEDGRVGVVGRCLGPPFLAVVTWSE